MRLARGDSGEKMILERLHGLSRDHNSSAGRRYVLSVSVGATRYDGGTVATVEQLLVENV